METNDHPVERRVRTAADLGEVIRSRRREQRRSQEWLADLVGTHRNQIRQLERGTPTERFTLLLDVLNELGLDLVVRPRGVARR